MSRTHRTGHSRCVESVDMCGPHRHSVWRERRFYSQNIECGGVPASGGGPAKDIYRPNVLKQNTN